MVEIDDLGLQWLTSGKGEELPCQSSGALGGNAHHVDPVARLLVIADGGAKQAQAADDNRQQIIEIVRNAPRHAPHRFELLRLAQRLFRFALLGHIEKGNDVAAGFYRIIEDLNRVAPIAAVFDQR